MKPPKATRLPSGNWHVRLRIKGQDINITRPTEAEAVAEAMAIRAGLKQPQTAQKDITLARAMDAYIDARKGILSGSTIRGYKIIRRNRFSAAMPLSIVHISRDQWQTFVRLEAMAVSPKTLQNSWRLIASVLRENGLAVPDVRLPARMPNEHPYLTPDQINTFVAAIKDKPVELAALLGLHGLRRSEICGLDWRDIDLGKKMMYVHSATVFDADNKPIIKASTKNAASTRYVPIMIDRLAELLAAAQRPNGRVVPDHPDTIYKRVNRICAENGLPMIGAHGLRHSFASLCQSRGVPEETTMLLGGWADFQTMRRHYTHFSEADIRSHVDAIKGFFAAPEDKKDNENDNDKNADN